MNESRYGSYVVLALVVGATALIANGAQTAQIINDFDSSGSTQLSFVAGWFGQASIALAMVCAVLIARSMSAPDLAAPVTEPDDAVGF